MSTEAKVLHATAMHAFRLWEIKFDVAVKVPATRLAWQRLIRNRCHAVALKSALFYAAYTLEGAQEFPKEFAAFVRTSEETLINVATLKKTLHTLMAPLYRRRRVASYLLPHLGLEERDSRLFENFPVALEKYEAILKSLNFPKPGKRHIETAAEIVRGEVLLHLYLEETTGRLCSEEAAVLLQASAESYGLEHVPNYSAEAVNRRYRRFRSRENSDHEEMRRLVRRIRRDGDRFLQNFLDSRLMASSIELRVHLMLRALMNSNGDGE